MSSGSSRRPSGTTATPAPRTCSGRRRVRSRSPSMTRPPLDAQHASDREHERRLAGTVGAEQRRHLRRAGSRARRRDDRPPASRDGEPVEAQAGPCAPCSLTAPPPCRGRRGSHARSRSTSAVGPEAISLPKSSTAVVSQQAETRLMSWSTRITSAPNCSGIFWITAPRCSVSSSGSPAAGSSSSTTRGLADHRARDLDEAPLARAEPADLRLRRRLQPDEVDRVEHIRATRRALRARVLVDHRDVVVAPTASRSPAPSGTCAAGPSAHAGSRPCEQVLAEGRDRSGRRLDEAAEDVEERRLAGAVRADQAAGAAREDDAHAVDRRHAGEADGQALDLDHAAGFSPAGCARARRDRAARGWPGPSGTAATSPPGAVSSTCRRPAPKRISRKFGLIPHCAWKRNGTQLLEDAGDDGTPEAEDAADHRRSGERERVLRLEGDRTRHPDLRGEQAAGDAGHERREREGPKLVERDVDACSERRRLALADRRPRATRLAGDVQRARAGTGPRRR